MAQYFYDTIELPDDLLLQYKNKSKKDEDMIYNMMLQSPVNGLTKSEIYTIYKKHNIKIAESSISRSLTNLADKLKIMKTREKRIGLLWKKPNSVNVLVTMDNIEVAKKIRETTPKNIKLKIMEMKLIMSSINFVLDNKQDLPESYITQLNNIYKHLNKLK
jgi:arginine repressor